MKNRMNTLVALSTLTAVLAVSLSACGESASADAKPSSPAAVADVQVNVRRVKLTPVTLGPGNPPIVAYGIAANRDEARLSFKVGGVIRELAVREGDPIRKGQLLARLETDEVDAGVRQAEEAHTKAARDLERGRNLFKEEVITREQLDDLTTAEAISRAALNSARYNRGYASIVAPADGFVLRRLAEDRELIAPGQPVLIVSSSQQGIVLRAGVPDRDVVKLHKGDSAELRFDALPGQRFTGTVQEVGQASDPRTGTYRVDIEITELQGATLISGMVGRASLTPQADIQAQRSYIPIEALIEGNQQRARIFILGADNKAVERNVQIAFISGDWVALRDALPAGTQVITEGATYLHDGETVQIAH